MKLVVLDRDGVINHDSDAYIKSPDEWKPIDGSLEAIADLTAAGFTVVVATNQSGLARKLFDEYTLARIHQKMCDLVEEAGGSISGVFYCPHGPDEGCSCRKPATGLLDEISRVFGISLAGAPYVGDSGKDLLAAKAAGCKPILVRTGNGEQTLATADETLLSGVTVVSNLLAAVGAILGSQPS